MRVLVIDEPWGHTPWLVQACIDRGMQVEVAVRREGLARCRLQGVRAHCLPDDHAAQPAAIARLLAEQSWRHLLPVSERLQFLCTGLAHPLGLAALPVNAEHMPLLVDRRAMLAFVAALGIDIPEQMALPQRDDVAAAAARLGWPLVMRGCQGTAGEQVRIARDINAATTAWQQLAGASSGDPFAQAFVHGEIVVVAGLFLAGEPLRGACFTLPERWPTASSPSVVIATAQRPAAVQSACRIFRALRFTGLACIELMQRPDGGCTFIELNPRAWGSLAATRAVGIDFPALYADLLAGEPPAAAAEPFACADAVLPLFPQYLKARMAGAGPGDVLRHPRLWWKGLRPAPWHRPRLLLALARQVLVAWRQRGRRPQA